MKTNRLGNDYVKDELFSMARAWDGEMSESPTCVREVMGSFPVGDSDISLSRARVVLGGSSFTFNYRA